MGPSVGERWPRRAKRVCQFGLVRSGSGPGGSARSAPRCPGGNLTSTGRVYCGNTPRGGPPGITDLSSGVIYTTDILDRETKDSYWLTVYATDHGVVPLYTAIEVYIQVEDVNDNAPLTSEPVYHPSVMENSPKDVSVVQIQAQDPDATATGDRLSYRISSGNPQNFFAIHSKTGEGAGSLPATVCVVQTREHLLAFVDQGNDVEWKPPFRMMDGSRCPEFIFTKRPPGPHLL
ncbi:hypothetical protein Z043_118198 [Scleropages formosus]|uniref:Cadherin domain-containing protein n=1 Tax=Scleropages formosus TaxID=113540 RepID=A0A0N8JXE8_SCLFO|nr:hypothetical protein Z043_118198 [Scleropages formosus]